MGVGPSVACLLHAACAVVYALLAATMLRRSRRSATGLPLAACCAATSLWAASVAARVTSPDGLADWLGFVRAASWCWLILHLYRMSVSRRQRSLVFTIIGVAPLVMAALAAAVVLLSSQAGLPLWPAGIAGGLGIAVCTLLLIENLYANTAAEGRWHVNLLCIAVGGLSLFDLVLNADALLFHRVSPLLFEGRASATILAAPLLALTASRNRGWAAAIHVSRTVAFHSATLVASGLFLLGLAAAGEIFRRNGAEWGNVAEISLISSGLLGIGVMVTSGSARSHLRALVVDHFFSRRYDYRREWMQCITTLSAPETYVGLQTRAIRAVAQVVDSPGGVLFVRDPEDAAFRWAGSWNMPAVTLPVPAGHPVVARFRGGDWIAELGETDAAAPGPEWQDWLAELPRAWLAVPLSHLGRLLGFVVVSRPRARFKLDREVFGLLRIVGHEVASHVAEQRATQVLTDTRQLQDYSKRFAFAVHDIKNVSSQLAMLLSNAELHAGNPAFQRDMLETVRAAVGKMSRMLARLQAREREHGRTIIVPMERLTGIAGAYLRTRGVTLLVDHDGRTAGVAIDPGAFDAVVSHLVDNAIEVADGPVRLRVRHEGLSVLIDIIDDGPGMSPAFIRDSLFRPFASTKRDGHGIGVYQARELLREAGGDLLVFSREAAGTTMRVLVPAVGASVAEPAPLSA